MVMVMLVGWLSPSSSQASFLWVLEEEVEDAAAAVKWWGFRWLSDFLLLHRQRRLWELIITGSQLDGYPFQLTFVSSYYIELSVC